MEKLNDFKMVDIYEFKLIKLVKVGFKVIKEFCLPTQEVLQRI